ncbi:hypothetical protein L3V86_00515 [Thiotrichales bacterium 19S11-10]|nr:hypothetical protein [Thiotrichales bacterium 19S11-10]MCF6808471.1 hypothetical protein [Thiotrichales bacterium 19S9-11]MCF6812441.1 hypothetical protein [Thiotrichales bacterium 19S9-12]
MNQQLQNILHLLITVVVLSIFYAIYPAQTYKPHGIYLPQNSQNYKDIATDSVRLLTAPPNGAPIGKINLLMHNQSTSQNELENILIQSESYIKELAAKHGANAVGPLVINRSGSGPLSAIDIEANAYRLAY